LRLPVTSPQTGHVDVVIVGGGIIGLLTAYELVESGARVTIVDRQSIAKESSWAGGGILSPLYPWRYPEAVTRLASWSQQHYAGLMQNLLDITGIDPQYLNSGLLISSPNEQEIAVKWAEKHKISLELVDKDTALQIQPGIQTDENSWIWMTEVAQVRNPKLLQALRAYMSIKGVKIIENEPISEIKSKSGRVTGLQSPQGLIPAERCLVATGAWSAELLGVSGNKLPIEPVKGQIILLKGKPGLVNRIVMKDSHYLIPRKDGRILVGSTLEYVGFDKSTTVQAREELTAAAEAIFPGITSECKFETQWAGLRPGSPEGIPYIGELPGVSGLFASGGHFRNGFVLAPASARLGADLILGREPVLDPAPYQLKR
jgi:glycine oxidase